MFTSVNERLEMAENIDPPASPSVGGGPNNGMATPPPVLIPKHWVRTTKSGKKIIPRMVENLEEKHCLCFNLFMCFMAPIICRCTPLELWEIPKIHSGDVGDIVVEKGEKGFAKRYEKYIKEKETYDREKINHPDLKEPSKPSLLFTLWFSIGGWSLVGALFLMLLSIGFQLVQPVFMRELVRAVSRKGKNPDEPFPFFYAIFLCLCPFLNSFFDAWGNRMLYHYSVQIRATMNGMVYHKVFFLDLASTSNIDRGKVISLVSNDARNASEQITQMFFIMFLPVQFFVPFGFVVSELGWPGLVGLAVLFVLGSSQFIFGAGINRALTAYMISNDQRNRMTNETLNGIKVVKLTGLEAVFVDRVIQSRADQLASTFYFTLFLELAAGFSKILPMMVNFSTFMTYVSFYGTKQADFGVKVIPTMGFLGQMTQPCLQGIMYTQAFTVVYIGVNRIRDFLLLPNLHEVAVKQPVNKDDAIVITNGAFKWSSGVNFDNLSHADRHEKEEKLKIMKEVELKSRQGIQNKTGATGARSKIESSTSASTSVFNNRTPSPDDNATPDADRPHLRNVNLTIKKGSLTMVVGGVGCGKSSLANALIGEIPLVKGELKRRGTFSYCAQTAWVTNNTIRGNITFGNEWDERRYLDVVHICALTPDVQSLPAGDLTAIGERGANLSGGQKNRIQLARCIYSNRDICVMDDPLSAVDVHVGKFLFQECICKYMAGKTRVLMTNQLQYLDRADKIIVLANGQIIGDGTYSELKANGLDFSQYIIGSGEDEKGDKKVEVKKGKKGEDKTKKVAAKAKAVASKKGEVKPKKGAAKAVVSKKGEDKTKKVAGEVDVKGKSKDTKVDDYAISMKTGLTLADLERGTAFNEEEIEAAKRIMTEEEYITKAVSPLTYGAYLITLMPVGLLVLYFMVTLVAEGGISFASYWMGIIGNAKKWPDVGYDMKLRVYPILIGIVFTFVMIRACWAAFAVRRSNRIIHDRLLKHVISAPLAFFDTTPMGRVLNRFTSELSQTDQFLHTYFLANVYFWLNMVGQIVVVSINTPFFLYIGIPTLFIYGVGLWFYSSTSRNLQRIDSIGRTPMISILAETIAGAGLPTIKAYKLEEAWKKRFNKADDNYSASKVCFKCGQKFASLYSSITSTLFMTGVVVIGWMQMNPSDLGVAINASMTFANFGLLIIMQNVELDSRMTSYERAYFYSSRLPQENHRALVTPPKAWPTKGEIVFDHVTFRYRPGLPFVLRDVSFTIKHGEKIGVCGRTGAGKSSLLFAMFRLVELDPSLMPRFMDVDTGFPIEEAVDETPNSGRILLDGQDISKVGLLQVRQSVSIIPQDPTLFTGSVRYNLDLSYKCSDEEVENVVDLIEMRQTIEEMPQGLDTPISESGTNFSCGQRQLLCFGRAVLNNSRVVILDEATAAVDVETDAKIQNMVRNHLKQQTVFVIAHRLNTIIGSDRILVLDAGRIVEFDTPTNLLNNPSSAFNSLIKSASQEVSV